ncbi:hypothetical protein JMN32_07500 [Fulvivirga sp. 29W222]|uniref:Uncharacterized protein n=1 Tax=Fulvivirga marina TaxID=2494733 RepID=A0A937KBH3_9BACT|nr:hypothetical protein [Fulvivirga marina]MBL6446147.1 hypothetical protein [Fulvivirga marina]
MNTSWETSKRKYCELLNGLDNLIASAGDLIVHYEQDNMEFAHLIYEKELLELMRKAEFMDDYEREFMHMYYSLHGQIQRLKRYREIVSLMVLKDPINIPKN